MEFEEACIILNAPEHLQSAITREYKISSKEEKQTALSDLKEAEEWLQERLKINGQDWLRIAADDKRFSECSKVCVSNLQEANTILKTAHKRPLTLRETLTLAVDMQNIGFDKAALLVYEVKDEERQRIISRANAVGTIKEKIDYIKGFHSIDEKGNLILW